MRKARAKVEKNAYPVYFDTTIIFKHILEPDQTPSDTYTIYPLNFTRIGRLKNEAGKS